MSATRPETKEALRLAREEPTTVYKLADGTILRDNTALRTDYAVVCAALRAAEERVKVLEQHPDRWSEEAFDQQKARAEAAEEREQKLRECDCVHVIVSSKSCPKCGRRNVITQEQWLAVAKDVAQQDAEIARLREALPTDAELQRLKEHAHALCGDSTRSWRQFGQHIVAIAERVEHARAALEGGSDDA